MQDRRPGEPVIDLTDPPSKAPSDPPLDSTVEMPHWTEPPAPAADATTGADPSAAGDKTEAWDGGAQGWGTAGPASLSDLGQASGLGEGSTSSTEQDMGASVDETTTPVDDGEATATSATKAGSRFRFSPASAEKAEALRSTSIGKRVATGGVFAGASLIAFAAGPSWVLALVTAVLVLGAMEFYDAVRRVGYRPATLLALVAVAGTTMAAYVAGEAAITMVAALTVVFTFLWYMFGITRVAPTSNIAVSILGYVWIGVLGAFAALLLRAPEERGLAFLIGAILVTIAYDTGAYVGGTLFGKRPLAPSISPSKTWEGLLTASLAAVAVGALLVQFISPWSFLSGLALGVVVSFAAPLGDLAESMVKRDLGMKDMGRILPGHGGILDRFDAMLFVLPATYYLVRILDLV